MSRESNNGILPEDLPRFVRWQIVLPKVNAVSAGGKCNIDTIINDDLDLSWPRDRDRREGSLI
jgi:hypothetical protein